ncbi:MAG: PAS domain-containing protein, partial [Verrucomicrobiales bacterium]
MSWLQGPQDSLQEFMDATHQDEDIQVVLEDSGTQSADAVIVWTDLALGTPEGLPQLLGSLSKTPVFVVASAANSQTMLEIVRLGAHDCFPKSEATPASLLRATRHAVHRQSSRTEHDDVALANVKEEIARSQQQLRDSEALYHSLVENLVQNIFRKDLDGRFTFANTNFCLAIGRHVDQVLGKTDFDFFPQDLATKYQSDDHKVIANGQALEAEEEHVTAADERLVVKVVKTPV